MGAWLSSFATWIGWSKPPPKSGPDIKFECVNKTQREEDAYDLKKERKAVIKKPIGTIATAAHLMKAALGSGLLGGADAYSKAGYLVSLGLNFGLGLYLFICLNMVGLAAQKICKRTAHPVLSYGQVGEAAMQLSNSKILKKLAKPFRIYIDMLIMLDLFGACVTYQLMISKTTKALTKEFFDFNLELNFWLLIFMVPIVAICLIRYLQWLAPFSIVGNCVIAIVAFGTVHYAFRLNPNFENLRPFGKTSGYFATAGMLTFSQSCACQILTVENSMADPKRFTVALSMGYTAIVSIVTMASFFGYVAFQDKVTNPVTESFPKESFPTLLRSLIVVMIYITHALNFHVPFSRAWFYIVHCIKEENRIKFEYFFRAFFVIAITGLAICFHDISGIMGLCGCFCLSNMGFICPSLIDIIVNWERPGMGTMNWRLWKDLVLLGIGMCIFLIGSFFAICKLAHIPI